jgi:hypothetical protein
MNSMVCCQNPEALSNADSPFTKIIALDFYDGPTGGILQCETCHTVYQFDMLDWDDHHQVRIFRLRVLPESSWEKSLQALEKAEPPPRWPVWVLCKWPSDDSREEANTKLSKILTQAKPAELVVAWLGYGERILAARKFPPKELDSEPAWLSVDDKSKFRDWFPLLGLSKEKANASAIEKNGGHADREKERQEALRQFQNLANASQFKSEGPYPTRDELHERP